MPAVAICDVTLTEGNTSMTPLPRKKSVTSRQASLAGYFAGALALGAVAMAGTFAAHATERLQLKTVVSVPNGGKITSFDISFVDTAAGVYILGDRTNKGIDVINTATNTYVQNAGAGLF